MNQKMPNGFYVGTPAWAQWAGMVVSGVLILLALGIAAPYLKKWQNR